MESVLNPWYGGGGVAAKDLNDVMLCRFLEAHRSIYHAERSRYAGFCENLLQTHRNIMTPESRHAKVYKMDEKRENLLIV